MTIEEILSIERYGLINTINDYTREHYVRSYTDILAVLIFPRDKEKIIKVVYRLLEWYEDNIEKILNNQHIYNKMEHAKSQTILKDLLSGLLKVTD